MHWISTFVLISLCVVIMFDPTEARWKRFGISNADEEREVALVHALPKCELHAHLHGSVRHSTLLDFIQQEIAHERERERDSTASALQQQQGEGFAVSAELAQWLETEQKVLQLTMLAHDSGDANKPFEIFPIIHKIIKRREQVARILREMIADYEHEHTLYLEVRTTPRGLPDGTSAKEYVDMLVDIIHAHNTEVLRYYEDIAQHTSSPDVSESESAEYLERINGSHKMLVKLILSIDRSKKASDANAIVDLALQTNARFPSERVVVGMDFSGNPLGGRFEDFESTFQYARREGLKITIHAAEMKELSESAGDSLDETSSILAFRPERLGHMLYLKEKHFEKMSELKKQGLEPLIELCPSTAFYMMGLNSFADHPHIRRLLSLNYPFSLNTDDSGIFQTNITEEILHMKRAVKLSHTDIGNSQVDSLRHVFATAEEQQKLQAYFWSWLAALTHKFPKMGLEAVRTQNERQEMDMSSLYTL